MRGSISWFAPEPADGRQSRPQHCSTYWFDIPAVVIEFAGDSEWIRNLLRTPGESNLASTADCASFRFAAHSVRTLPAGSRRGGSAGACAAATAGAGDWRLGIHAHAVVGVRVDA